jgi:hypothetical protein
MLDMDVKYLCRALTILVENVNRVIVRKYLR